MFAEVDWVAQEVIGGDSIIDKVLDPRNHTQEVLIASLIVIFAGIILVAFYAVRGSHKTRSQELDMREAENKRVETRLTQEREARKLDREQDRLDRAQERQDDRLEKEQARADLLELRKISKESIKASQEVTRSIGDLVEHVGNQNIAHATQFSELLAAVDKVPNEVNTQLSENIVNELSKKLGHHLIAGFLVVNKDNKVISWNTKGVQLLFPDLIDPDGVIKDFSLLDLSRKELEEGTSIGRSLSILDLLDAVRSDGTKQRRLLEICLGEKAKLVMASAHPFTDGCETAEGLVSLTFGDLGEVTRRKVVL